MSNYHLLIIQHSYQFLKKRECLYIKVVIFAMGNSSNTGNFKEETNRKTCRSYLNITQVFYSTVLLCEVILVQ